MVCCLNPDCSNPQNPPQTRFCQSCGEAIVPLLLNRFKVTKVLGRGGFGKTYLAEDTHKFDENCVVKQLVPNTQGTWAKKKAIELFKLEAQQLQQLGEHHHIPSLYAYFEQDGYLYLVQQFIQGQNLLEELEEKGVWHEAAIKNLLLELLPVLSFVHKNGVIHRDIKLENIMRRQTSTRVGKTGDLVLIDFGVSKQLSSTVLTTAIGTMIGSQGYAPLEQMRGGKAYPASDLFSLGATCFHLLTNIHPGSLQVEQGYSWIKNWCSHLPSRVSSDFIRVMDRLLVKDVKLRYQSAHEVIRDLQTPIVSSPPPLPKIRSTVKLPSPSPTVLSHPPTPKPKQKPVSKPQRQPRKSNNYSPSQGKRKPGKRLIRFFRKRIIVYAAIQLIVIVCFVGYASFNSLDTNIENANLFATLTTHSDPVMSIVFSSDGKTLASGSWDNTIKLWDLETKTVITTLSGHSNNVNSLALSPDGKTLASGSLDQTIKLWDLETKTIIDTLTGHSNSVISIAFSPDGRTLASGSRFSAVKLWDLETKTIIDTLNRYSNFANSIAFSPDGRTLASGSLLDQTIKLWDLETKTGIATLSGHSDSVISIAFSPDGKTLASGSSDDTIKLWDLETKIVITTLTGHSGDVKSVAFSPDGKTLASGSWDDTIKLWRVP